MSLSQKSRRRISYTVFLVILAGIGLVVYLVINEKKNEFKTSNNPQKAKEIALSLKEQVGKIYVLPSEDPVVATVTDTKALPENDFYKKAENGDKILIFEASKKIILYRPSANKVVDVGSLETPPPPPAQEVAGMTNPDATSSSQFITTPKILFNKQPNN